ncbi:MAG: hypothetical protein H7A32_04990 [Deltaproteobacteria bacterium]|nr:hypothetical protein [Deltaproteobacteria bacterium]
MGKVLILQNAALFSAGTFESELQSREISYSYHKVYEEDVPIEDILPAVSGLIVLGGPLTYRVTQPESSTGLKKLLSFLSKALEMKIPCIGVAQGACLLARAKGAWVEPAPEKQLGWINAEVYPDYSRNSVIYSKVEEKKFPVFTWCDTLHGFPPEGYWYLNSPKCRYLSTGINGNSYLFNFHPEITEEMVGQWLQHYFQDLGSKELAAQLKEATREHIEQAQAFSHKIIHAFESFLR